jgi:hypothetical protein
MPVLLAKPADTGRSHSDDNFPKGESNMRTRNGLLLTLVLVALLIAAALPVSAGPPEKATGVWEYFTYVDDMKTAGCNTFLTVHDDGRWTGTFHGPLGNDDPAESYEEGRIVLHCSGAVSFNGIVTFDEVYVDGQKGGLVISVNGRTPDGTALPPVGEPWQGRWVILSGTGELENLHGSGDWWGPGAGEPFVWGFVEYGGKTHFAPNK